MPSPVGHALAGLTVHILASQRAEDLLSPGRAILTVSAALLPDIDLAFQLVDGRNHHGNETHSLGAAALAALVVWAVAGARGVARPRLLAAATGAAWFSHVVLDFLNRDTHPPIGILALWPLSSEYFKIPWPLFLDIGRTLEWSTVRHDLLAALWECVVLLPFLWGAWRFRLRRLR
jgi:membrane-bound metal-dependent hydrolase YbcI (DUF457 family)